MLVSRGWVYNINVETKSGHILSKQKNDLHLLKNYFSKGKLLFVILKPITHTFVDIQT